MIISIWTAAQVVVTNFLAALAFNGSSIDKFTRLIVPGRAIFVTNLHEGNEGIDALALDGVLHRHHSSLSTGRVVHQG